MIYPFSTLSSYERAAHWRHILWPDATEQQWSDWRWQQVHRIRSVEELAAVLPMSKEEQELCHAASKIFPIGITPYYASLINIDDVHDPIRLQCVPQGAEQLVSLDECEDPLAEERYMPVQGLTHRYPDRALLYSNHNCPVYCRHCNRRRKVGDPTSTPHWHELEKAIDYVRKTPSIRDVLVSGGDPLSFADGRLIKLLQALRDISHLEIIRLATRNPVTLPYRVTEELAQSLRTLHPIYVSTHFNHINECSIEAAECLQRLADAGCVISNQMVLLKGINNDAEMVKQMNHWLLKHRCRPYYIFQCDAAEGIAHFRTPVADGVALIEQLRGWTSGLAVPHYVIDLPGGGGKVSMQPTYHVANDTEKKQHTFRNYLGETYTYAEP